MIPRMLSLGLTIGSQVADIKWPSQLRLAVNKAKDHIERPSSGILLANKHHRTASGYPRRNGVDDAHVLPPLKVASHFPLSYNSIATQLSSQNTISHRAVPRVNLAGGPVYKLCLVLNGELRVPGEPLF